MYMFEMLMADAVPDEKAAKENKALKIWIVVSDVCFMYCTVMYSCSVSMLSGHMTKR